MCTVSFVPLKKSHFILTSNRDETVARGLASSPVMIQKGNYQVICPVDPLASGTWIAASSHGDVICLLNGAFKKHRHQPPYRKSRGLVVLDYFDFENPLTFEGEYDLSRIEPFTMVIVQGRGGIELYELRWDGNQKHFKQLNENESYLWSSVTLYNEQIDQRKRALFMGDLRDVYESLATSPENMMGVHSRFLYEDWVMPPERVGPVATLSITSVESNSQDVRMHYRDLVRKELPVARIELSVSN